MDLRAIHVVASIRSMTIFDLLFLVCALVAIGTIVRAAYLALRGRSHLALRTLVRLAVGSAIYGVVLVVVSMVQPEREVAVGDPHCFDDFCIAVDSAARLGSIGSVASAGDFVVVSGRVISKARRRQRETDVRGVLRDDEAGRHEVSTRGQQALRELGRAGNSLTDFVEPERPNTFELAFDVPKTSRTFEFITAHGWLPGALIIGGAESLFHRPTVVHVPVSR
jgi:hypothetical protein